LLALSFQLLTPSGNLPPADDGYPLSNGTQFFGGPKSAGLHRRTPDHFGGALLLAVKYCSAVAFGGKFIRRKLLRATTGLRH
jgi:hypothetical protein